MKTTFRSLLLHSGAAAAIAGSAMAQITYDPNIGSPIGAGDDTLTTGLALGFPFAFPGGTSATMIDVDSNGRILLPSTDATDWSESTAELFADPASICAHWDDLTFASTAADDIYYNALPSVALITWKDVVIYGGSDPFTFQVQLHANGHVGFVYDNRVPTADAIVGLSSGNGVADPGSQDLSTARGGALTTSGNPTTYERWTTGFDLQNTVLEFVPDGMGGWVVIGSDAGFGQPASAEKIGKPCTTAVEFIPGSPGTNYFATPTTADYVDPIANGHVDTGITQDDEVAGPFALGFTFTWPGGSTTSQIDIDSNGRILPPGADTSDFSPTAAELMNDSHPTISGFHIDFRIPAIGGNIMFGTTATSATVTWLDIAQYGGDQPITVQTTLHADGRVTTVFDDTMGWEGGATGIVGLSAGNGAVDPGESDLSSGLSMANGSELYEVFDLWGGEEFDLQMVTEATRPVFGAQWDVNVKHLPASTSAVSLLIGLVNPNADLNLVPAIGAPGCVLVSNGDIGVVPLTISGDAASLSLTMTTDPTLEGLSLFVQAAAIAPGVTPSGLVLSNGYDCVIGS